MKYYEIPNSNLIVSKLALGCMRLAELSFEEAEKLIYTAREWGINVFDHADIYGNGKSETIFGEVLKKNPTLRKQIIIQTKCGIKEGYYDSSEEHILASVNASLERLNTDYLDVLLIHRPDALTDFRKLRRLSRFFAVKRKSSFWRIKYEFHSD